MAGLCGRLSGKLSKVPEECDVWKHTQKIQQQSSVLQPVVPVVDPEGVWGDRLCNAQ